MHTLVSKLDNLSTSYKLSKLTAKTDHIIYGPYIIAFGFVEFEGFRLVTKLKYNLNTQVIGSPHTRGCISNRQNRIQIYSYVIK